MKIYFAGSIRGGRDDAALYAALISRLRAFGEVLTEHVGDPELTRAGDDGPDDRSIHDRDMAWLAACDLIVAEVTMPSLGVGYELGCAVSMGKPVLCLHRPVAGRPLSAMVAGSGGIRTAAYADLDEAMKMVVSFLDAAGGCPVSRRPGNPAADPAGSGGD
jgi:nucleoside 2-deoxyribosyltransferase